MPETIPRAGFTDPLLAERSQRRMAYFTGSMKNPFVIVLMLAAIALAFISPYLIPAAWVLVAVAAFYLANQKASGEWWLLLLDHLGMTPLPGGNPQPLTPLLRSGDEREVLRAATDSRRSLLIFRRTEVSTDSKGNKSRSHHDYTVVLLRDETPAIRFLSAHEHNVSFMKFLGDGLRGKTLRGVDEFKVESVQLHERFELRSSTEDGQRARQIFKPSFIVWFTHSGVDFEYEEGELVVFVDRVLEHAEEFKMLLTRADEIHAAISGG